MADLFATRTLLSARLGRVRVSLEAKIPDLWIGAFFTRREAWICLVPCLPIHVELDPIESDYDVETGRRRCPTCGLWTLGPCCDGEEESATVVCPGCYAVGPEPCAVGCPDAELERAREDLEFSGDMGDPWEPDRPCANRDCDLGHGHAGPCTDSDEEAIDGW